VFSLKFLFLK